MGTLEDEAKNLRRKDYIQQAVLSAIGIAGILALTAVAPNTLQLLGTFKGKRRFKYQAQSVLSRLAAKGYVRFVTKNGKKHVEVTSAGRRTIDLEIQISMIRSKKPKHWDKRWRMVMFDIPEHRKKDRDQLRRTMIEAGMYCFQDSVWVFPYECEELFTLLKLEMHFGNAVRYAVVEKLENDAEIKKHFKLN